MKTEDEINKIRNRMEDIIKHLHEENLHSPKNIDSVGLKSKQMKIYFEKGFKKLENDVLGLKLSNRDHERYLSNLKKVFIQISNSDTFDQNQRELMAKHIKDMKTLDKIFKLKIALTLELDFNDDKGRQIKHI